jgi:hypothetical protein
MTIITSQNSAFRLVGNSHETPFVSKRLKFGIIICTEDEAVHFLSHYYSKYVALLFLHCE